ncbi:Predicted DNA-binding transcriptional regulator YafY, contains an HTH and WYL domains [Jatrophihabitans endophyticus]|uniref:Predicted DNA-binding transcriptional regulator YafY, contains an HTH and WYL domains n=1 Tax=Jatrophihabitans endophyticus TaxID=1206085 RepID=A0A1M5KFY2_9ACTN|nr:WYL domain-containing protein [Jatrophihabitans endophyticus]SHG51844.1 Predicted DNA-binding transcriptional regulator YafY, contains an HTH and WYL domains [Jatrophihabitans endophyticus]
MKSSRLLSLLLLLQTHQRTTTAELARRLEVSRRTVLRDVASLAAAGVPVYAERGRHGGIVLLAGARLNAAHLDPGEIEALRLTGLDRDRLAQLGLHAAAEQAGRKLAARGAPPGPGASLADLVVVDNAGWTQPRGATDAADLAEALRLGRRLRIAYRRSGEPAPTRELVDPYGLAAKAGRWYLVADVAGAPRLFALARLTSYELTSEPSRPRAGQTLASVWEALRARSDDRGNVRVRAWLRADRLDLARRVLGSRLVDEGRVEDDRQLVTVAYESVEGVRQLLQFGDHVEVLDPPEARRRVAELAADLARRHAADPAPS